MFDLLWHQHTTNILKNMMNLIETIEYLYKSAAFECEVWWKSETAGKKVIE